MIFNGKIGVYSFEKGKLMVKITIEASEISSLVENIALVAEQVEEGIFGSGAGVNGVTWSLEN